MKEKIQKIIEKYEALRDGLGDKKICFNLDEAELFNRLIADLKELLEEN